MGPWIHIYVVNERLHGYLQAVYVDINGMMITSYMYSNWPMWIGGR
jgi:hypothetical protein